MTLKVSYFSPESHHFSSHQWRLNSDFACAIFNIAAVSGCVALGVSKLISNLFLAFAAY